MALIDLNNAIRTKRIYSEKNTLEQVDISAPPYDATYLDLHLDLVQMKTVGLGLSEAESGDILVDYDLNAIKNSIRNIFTTKKGQKILNPDFGCSLEQYLFTPISEVNAKVIGGEILRGVSKYEPRIKITNIYVVPIYDQNLYKISVYYSLLEIKKQNIINIIALVGGQITIT